MEKAWKNKMNAFELWCYRRILKISWIDKITNVEVFDRMQTRSHFWKDIVKRKLEFAGHVLRGSSGENTPVSVGRKGRGKKRQR